MVGLAPQVEMIYSDGQKQDPFGKLAHSPGSYLPLSNPQSSFASLRSKILRLSWDWGGVYTLVSAPRDSSNFLKILQGSTSAVVQELPMKIVRAAA